MGLPPRHLNEGQVAVTQPTLLWASPCVISQDGGPLGRGVVDGHIDMPYMLMCPREGPVCSQRAQPH